MIEYLKRLFKRQKPQKPQTVLQDSYAPRKTNTAYPNDSFAKQYMKSWLNEVVDKHHGG